MAFLLAGLATWPVRAAVTDYAFTSIAQSSETLGQQYNAVINATGQVAFLGFVDGKWSVFRGDGVTLDTILASSDTVTVQPARIAIDAAGRVLFVAQVGDVTGVYRSAGGSLPAPLADTSGSIQSIQATASVGGDLFVYSATYDQSEQGVKRTFATDGGGATTLFEFDFPWLLGPPSASETGFVAIAADYYFAVAEILRATVAGGAPATIADTMTNPETGVAFCQLGFATDVEAAGRVAFTGQHRVGSACSSGVFTSAGAPEAEIVVDDASSPLGAFGAVTFGRDGEVVFEASRIDGFVPGIYTGPDPEADRVIEVGDALFDSTVSAVSLGTANDAGQIAFRADLADGRVATVRADPVPEPGAGALACCALAAVARTARRRGA